MRTSGFDPLLAEILSRRLKIIAIFVIVILSTLLLRLWFLQIVKGPMYRVQSENNRIQLQKIPPYRGLIKDRNDELLVDNKPSYDLYIIPEDVQNKERLFSNIKQLISLDLLQSSQKLKKSNYGRSFEPVLIKKNITREELAVIETNLFNLPGIFIQVRPQRNYIYGTLASHILGYLGEISEKQLKSGKYTNNSTGDFIGQYGVESIWQNQLNGTRGWEQIEVDAKRRKLRTISQQPPVPGYNINLTIDKDLQLLAENSLKDKAGAIVAIDPFNGEVLAMANGPAIDPNKFVDGINQTEWNKYVNSKEAPFQNRAIGSQYPPGSIFKMVVAFAGLEEGVIDPEEEIYCNGIYKLGNHTYKCWKLKQGGHGNVNLQGAMQGSCDVYFYKLGKKLGIDTIARYARMFGLGQKTNIDLNSEEDGIMPDRKWKLKKYGIPWQQGETISSAIGQSYVNVTPIQMARLMAAVFNGGKIYQPGVVKRVGNRASSVYNFSPSLQREIDISRGNMELIKQSLVAVVNDPKGTAYPYTREVRNNGIIMAGKTGTAQVVALEKTKKLNPDDEVPSKYEDHAWFVAIAPVEDPEIAIAVLIEHGGGGSSAAAPVASKLIKQYLKQ